jgi:2-isopropylmalate synthase
MHAAIGPGPVDACYTAINYLVGVPVKLVEFAVNAVTEGTDALGEVSVRIEYQGEETVVNPQREVTVKRTFGGHAADTDIIVASARAYLSALNKLVVAYDLWQTVPESVPAAVS